MSYVIPADLPQVPLTWQDWPLAARVEALPKDQRPAAAKLAAVAITLHEQPGRIPVSNCCGLMSWGRQFPWGWRRSQWLIRPVGYALIREGQTGIYAPFLAFTVPADSLAFLLGRVAGWSSPTAHNYAVKWVGAEPGTAGYRSAVAGFERWLRKVQEYVWALGPGKPEREGR